ncbi:MAG: protein kinase [Anaerolineae bacterium]|nr:protein kinase [Anaerolineae bacterium]
MNDDIGMIIDGYKLKKCIYDNKYGNKVYEATHDNTSAFGRKTKVAIKVYKDPHRELPALHEGMVLADVIHPNLIELHHYGYLPDGRLYIVMKWFESQTLADYVQNYPYTDAVRILQILNQVSHGLDELHKMRYWHGDLHDGNILMYLKEKHEAPTITLIDVHVGKHARHGDSAAHAKAVRADILSLAAVARKMFFGAYEELNPNKYVRVREFLSAVINASDEEPMHSFPRTVRDFMNELLNATNIHLDSWYNHRVDTITMERIRQTGETPALVLPPPEPIQPRPRIAPAAHFKSRRILGYGVAIGLIVLMAAVMMLVMGFGQPACQSSHLTVVASKVAQCDPVSGRYIAISGQHSANTWGISPDNRYLATDFVVLERSTGGIVQNLERFSPAQAVAFSTDGRLFARHDGTLLSIWQLPDFTLLYQLPDIPIAQTHAMLTPDGFKQFISAQQRHHQVPMPPYSPYSP